MNTIRALLIKNYGGPEVAQVSTIPQPQAGPGQVLVRVTAAGLIGLDWKVRVPAVRDAYRLHWPAVSASCSDASHPSPTQSSRSLS